MCGDQETRKKNRKGVKWVQCFITPRKNRKQRRKKNREETARQGHPEGAPVRRRRHAPACAPANEVSAPVHAHSVHVKDLDLRLHPIPAQWFIPVMLAGSNTWRCRTWYD